jgi:hypothetical protein
VREKEGNGRMNEKRSTNIFYSFFSLSVNLFHSVCFFHTHTRVLFR